MGSNADAVPPQEDEITVLVTGFAPFKEQYPINPAWQIAKALPLFLPPAQPQSASSSGASTSPSPPVRILVHPEAVRVSYNAVRDLVPKLWEGKKIDYTVHIGMASGRKFYSLERRGHRDGYVMKDVDGELLGDAERREKEGARWVWHGLPDELFTSVAVDDVWTRWRSSLPNLDLRISENAGRYLCDFIYYSSLAYLTRKEEDKRVVFLHVPVASDEVAVKTGIEVTIELIRAVVQSGAIKKKLAREQTPKS
ncbi:Pyroglutamyl peptidase type [Venustampulla echinocandica]|uniref:Pyroglutamyl peptidase type n=1 Tax=Venustampulla echinocandica TaxID=2656787 RepID=A0A370T8V6_9HELO|nr:Pyroglutamyl peptidase type [Venustampulla echinocandica]RDL29920.1 Pyroglutamyl peptidase type [Venustampulla echinocandica]